MDVVHAMPFGRFRGSPPQAIPTHFLLAYLRRYKLGTGLRKAIRQELLTRHDGPEEDDLNNLQPPDDVRAHAAALGLEAVLDRQGWCILRRSGSNLAARGHNWPEAFERFERLPLEAKPEPRSVQRGLFDSLLQGEEHGRVC